VAREVVDWLEGGAAESDELSIHSNIKIFQPTKHGVHGAMLSPAQFTNVRGSGMSSYGYGGTSINY
jgi:hypothetical protein